MFKLFESKLESGDFWDKPKAEILKPTTEDSVVKAESTTKQIRFRIEPNESFNGFSDLYEYRISEFKENGHWHDFDYCYSQRHAEYELRDKVERYIEDEEYKTRVPEYDESGMTLSLGKPTVGFDVQFHFEGGITMGGDIEFIGTKGLMGATLTRYDLSKD